MVQTAGVSLSGPRVGVGNNPVGKDCSQLLALLLCSFAPLKLTGDAWFWILYPVPPRGSFKENISCPAVP